jgi:methylphosphotriester-DNA--protein-cysteine methyltransferase
MIRPYREFKAPVAIAPVVACTWEHQPATDQKQLVIPDGCVDLIWLAEGELVIAGADTGPRQVELSAGVRTSGIRFRPGTAGAMLGIPASELRDQQVSAALVWAAQGVELEQAMSAAVPARQRALLAAVVAARRAEPDRLVTAAAERLGAPGVRVADLAHELGVSERQLHRRTLAAVGYGPKMLARVARLRRLIASDGPLAWRSLEAGYASQAHMSDEVRRLTGFAPVRFLEDAGLTAA